MISSPTQAQLWDYIVTSESGNRYYIDPLSIQRKGSIVNYIQLINYPQGTDLRDKGMLSFVQFKTNDCSQHRFNISRLIGYEHENAKGSVVTVEFSKEEKWLTINPKKIADIIHQEVCHKFH
jgi:hypothetical protein